MKGKEWKADEARKRIIEAAAACFCCNSKLQQQQQGSPSMSCPVRSLMAKAMDQLRMCQALSTATAMSHPIKLLTIPLLYISTSIAMAPSTASSSFIPWSRSRAFVSNFHPIRYISSTWKYISFIHEGVNIGSSYNCPLIMLSFPFRNQLLSMCILLERRSWVRGTDEVWMNEKWFFLYGSSLSHARTGRLTLHASSQPPSSPPQQWFAFSCPENVGHFKWITCSYKWMGKKMRVYFISAQPWFRHQTRIWAYATNPILWRYSIQSSIFL